MLYEDILLKIIIKKGVRNIQLMERLYLSDGKREEHVDGVEVDNTRKYLCVIDLISLSEPTGN